MEPIRFETPEDLELDVEVAGPLSRLLAVTLDHILLALCALVLVLALTLLVGLGETAASFGLHLAGFLIVLYGFAQFAYFTLFEITAAGRTPGKRWLGLTTVMEGGYALTPGAALIRNLFRILDMIPLLWVVPVLDGKQRRLGDIVAGTLVVRTVRREFRAMPFVAPEGEAEPRRALELGAADAQRLLPQDLAVLEDFFHRYGGMALEPRRRLARRLAEGFLQTLERPRPPGVSDYALLKEIYLVLREKVP